MKSKPRLSFWQIWNMSFGFLGIQFGWGLQMANMSPIYTYLDADPDQLPLLWLAAPVTGLLIQPIIGYMSDRTWSPFLGRRRPFFLIGAILSSIALLLMPNSSSLWMAAGLLWVLDASVNISMEPFRALVADLTDEKQRNVGFTVQAVFIGLGIVLSSLMPYILRNVFGVESGEGTIPQTVKYSFYIGAAVFLGAVLWTIFTTKEHPPEDMEAFKKMKEETAGIGVALKEIKDSMFNMPRTMVDLAYVQFFTWSGLFCMWLFFVTGITESVFGATSSEDPNMAIGNEWGGVCFAFYALVTFLFAFILPHIANTMGRKMTHMGCLFAGGIGLISVFFIRDQYLLLVSMAGVGIAWASIVSLPYAMLAGSLPEKKIGFYMGLFNFFIVIPQILVAIMLGPVMRNIFGNNMLLAVVLGGICFIIAGLLTMRVYDPFDRITEETPL